MRVYIDTEFNGFDGNLISIGAVAYEDGVNHGGFYGVLQPAPGDKPHPWVAKHVIPVLWSGRAEQRSLTLEDLRRQWQSWLRYMSNEHGALTIIADWYEDLAWAARLMVNPEGRQLHPRHVPRLMCIDTGNIDLQPEVRHNALSDAKALAGWRTIAPHRQGTAPRTQKIPQSNHRLRCHQMGRWWER